MRLAVLLGSESFASDPSFIGMRRRLEESGMFTMDIVNGPLTDGYDMLLSVGGDGTYLNAVDMAASLGLPVLGVNLGRVGFLSENEPSDVAEALISDDFRIIDTALLTAVADGRELLAFNEVSVTRAGGAMLGIEAEIDGRTLPVYWADGLLVSTPSGSTAYSLSVGGPIVFPGSNVLVISPIASHNLNVRPLVIPQGSRVSLRFKSRDSKVNLTADNKRCVIDASSRVDVSMARFSLKRVCLSKSNYIKALSDKLYWGEDKRNERKN